MMYHYVIVDDEPIARRGTLKKIEKSKLPFVCVGEASNGNEGLELIKDKKPDVVILDMRMPQTDGVELLSLLEKEGLHPQILIASGYSDFEYARKAIKYRASEYLLKPFSVEEITDSLNHIIKNLASEADSAPDAEQNAEITILQKYLYNTYSESDKDFTFEYFPIQKTSGRWIVAELNVSAEPQKALYVLEEAPQSSSFLKIFEKPEHNGVCSVVFYTAGNKSLNNEFSEMLDPIVTKYGLKCGVSACETIYELSRCLKEAGHARKDIALEQSAQILWFELAEPAEIKSKLYDSDMLLYLIEAGKNDRVVTCFQEMYRSALKMGLSLNQLESIWIEAYEEIRCFFIQKKADENIPTKYHLASFLQAFPDDSLAIAAEAANFFIRIFCSLVDENAPHDTGPYYEIKHYIDTHYTNPLSLYLISEIFYLNPSYVSQLFKAKGQTTFNRYVTQLRVDKAKELLEADDLSVNDVAKAAGFENEKYFFKVFKKETGHTPSQYRILHFSNGLKENSENQEEKF